MSDANTLTATQVRESGLGHWRQILGRIRARFRTRNFATGLDFVNRIGAAAEAANHHPDITLTYPEVIITLVSHDAGGLTGKDVDLAREISRIADDLGLSADTAGLTQLELGLDTAHGETVAPFYAALLGSPLEHGEPVDPSGQVPTIWWQEPGGPEDRFTLPAPETEQRWHFDVWVPHDEAPRRLQAVLDAGGTLVSDAAAPAYWVVADADGNRSCICTPTGR